MIKQNDPNLRKEIQAYGCNFLAHLAIARTNYSAAQVESLYQQALAANIIDANCTVKQPQELLALAGSNLRQIGGLHLGGESWGLSEDNSRVRFRVARWKQRNSRHQHFTLFNTMGEIYDPYDATLATYKLEKEQLLGYQLYG